MALGEKFSGMPASELRGKLHESRKQTPFRPLVLEALRNHKPGTSKKWNTIAEHVFNALSQTNEGPAVDHLDMHYHYYDKMNRTNVYWRETQWDTLARYNRERNPVFTHVYDEIIKQVLTVMRNLPRECIKLNEKNRSFKIIDEKLIPQS